MKPSKPEKRKTFGIGAKVNGTILITLVLGFGAVTGYFGWSLVTTRQTLTSVSLQHEADLLATSVVNFMLPGEAPIAVAFFKDVSVRNPEFEIALYRRNGTGAFSDSTTAAGVNKRIGKDRFPLDIPRPSFAPADAEALAPAVALPPSNTLRELTVRRENGRTARIVSVYRPLINLPKCVGCHGGDHTIRGVVRVSTDVSAAVEAQQASIAISGGIFFFMVTLVGTGLARFMRRAVVAPVTEIGAVCRKVAAGDFEGGVAYRAADEIGELAFTVNEMALGLRERAELSKYVSVSTLAAVSGDQKGKRKRRTILFSDVRGFTAFSERRPAEKVVDALNNLLDAQARVVGERGGDVDKFVGDQIVAVFDGPGAERRACQAALDIHRAAKGPAGEAEGERLSVGVGIASGEVIRGMIGSSSRADFTVIGDAVNIASRLCASAKPGMTIVHFDPGARMTDEGFNLSGPFKLALKGKKEKQAVYLLKESADEA